MAQIPILIPQKIKNELIEMGYDEIMLKYMTPQEAWDITDGKLSMVDYVINKSFELLDINENDEFPDIGQLTISQLEDLLDVNPLKNLTKNQNLN